MVSFACHKQNERLAKGKSDVLPPRLEFGRVCRQCLILRRVSILPFADSRSEPI